MNDIVLLGRGHDLVPIPFATVKQHLADLPEHTRHRLAFMTEAHHRVRYWVVEQLPRAGQPIPPEAIADQLQLPLDRVKTILDELEKHLFFLVRNEQGAVAWAYPVTIEPTPHRLTFNTGETVYAA